MFIRVAVFFALYAAALIVAAFVLGVIKGL
jgi:hypothetical protein